MIKETIMRKAILAKFQAHPEIKKILIETENEIIIENSPFDHYWGIGQNGEGQNRLGILLMELREYFKKISF